MAFVAVFLAVTTGLLSLSGLSIGLSSVKAESSSIYKNMANNNVKALKACIASCRARTQACYASGNTGSCKSQHIACVAACQSSINSRAPQAYQPLYALGSKK